ncbi:MAG: hypothetical protein ACI4JT_00180 [Oscillospiraceae bacterium]
MSNSTVSKRLQVTVPICDTTVIEWLDKQESASESVRTVIKDYVVRHGMTDAAVENVLKPKMHVFACHKKLSPLFLKKLRKKDKNPKKPLDNIYIYIIEKEHFVS